MLVARERFNSYDLPLRGNTSQSRVKRVRKISVKTKALYCAIVLITMGLAFLLTSKYAQIASVGYEIVALKKQAQALEAENQVLLNKVAQFKSLDNIEYVAVTKLGMQKPEMAEGVQFVPVEYSKSGSKLSAVETVAETGTDNRPAPREKKNSLVQTLATMING